MERASYGPGISVIACAWLTHATLKRSVRVTANFFTLHDSGPFSAGLTLVDIFAQKRVRCAYTPTAYGHRLTS